MSDAEEKKEVKVDVKEEPKEEAKKESKKENAPLAVRDSIFSSVFDRVQRVFDEVDAYFRNFWMPTSLWDFRPFSLKLFEEDEFFRTPLANIKDEGDHFLITAELPGLDKSDIEITVNDGRLEIKGVQETKEEEKGKGYIKREYYSSKYYRCFSLPENIDEDKIEASLDKGILKITLPKIEVPEKEKKKIEVK